MAAYIIANVDVTDPAAYDNYRKQVMATVTKYGGKFLVRGGALTKLEGDQSWARVVVLEFSDSAAARKWYDSSEYRPLIKLRQSASRSNLIMVDGV
ncbi:MAG TPA: DUF1330 domain-containing protein [Candidatus Cybelea sp.]|nr:DUF1330 domain-containing protein [Candidatus Cybelea sp.]